MWTGEDGRQQQGQLYVTERSLALHGAFGFARRVVPLAQVAGLAPQAIGEKVTSFRLALPTGGLTLSAMNALGGSELMKIVHTLIAQPASGTASAAPVLDVEVL